MLRPIHFHFICLFINYDRSVERGNLYKVIDISISHDLSDLFKHNRKEELYAEQLQDCILWVVQIVDFITIRIKI